MIILTLRNCEVNFVPAPDGQYNAFTIPNLGYIIHVTISQALDYVEKYLKNGQALKVEYL